VSQSTIDSNEPGIPVSDLTGERIELRNSTANTVEGESVWVTQSAVRRLNMNGGTFTQSAAAHMTSDDIALHQSSVGMLKGGQIDLYDSSVGLARGPVTVKDGKAVVFLHIGQSDCGVKPVLDAKSAVAVGAGIGFGFALLGSVVRRLFRD
jgi:hypothetical protein